MGRRMSNRSTASRVYLTVIGLMLATAGGVFTWLMWRSFSRAREIETWPRAEAVILKSEVEERRIDPGRPAERRFAVLYAYEWEGEEYQSERFGLRGSGWTSKSAKVEGLVKTYPVGGIHEVWVNPADPAVALLSRESRAPGYSIWFPALVTAGGLGMMIGAWRK